jgi:gas vesicle protein
MATEQNDAAGYLGWFFLGGVIGAAAALLLTPRTGQQTRELLVEHGGEFARRAQEAAT